MPDADVGSHVPHLLLAVAPDFFDIVENLLERGEIGKLSFQKMKIPGLLQSQSASGTHSES
jgi:hypothetical protein